MGSQGRCYLPDYFFLICLPSLPLHDHHSICIRAHLFCKLLYLPTGVMHSTFNFISSFWMFDSWHSVDWPHSVSGSTSSSTRPIRSCCLFIGVKAFVEQATFNGWIECCSKTFPSSVINCLIRFAGKLFLAWKWDSYTGSY